MRFFRKTMSWENCNLPSGKGRMYPLKNYIDISIWENHIFLNLILYTPSGTTLTKKPAKVKKDLAGLCYREIMD